jgi:hypothetical protein
MKLLSLWFAFLMGPRLYFSSNRQSTSSTQSTANYDNRIGVGDQGILAGDGANVGNDNRDFTDNSALTVTSNTATTTTTTGSNNDNRDLSDNSVFSVVSTDNRSSSTVDSRDFSDRSSFSSVDNRVTNITSADPEIVRAAAAASEASARYSALSASAASDVAREIGSQALDTAAGFAGAGSALVESSLRFGDAVTERSQAGILDVFKTAAGIVADSAREDREFAGAFVGKVFETTKSADQQNTEKLVKAGTVVAGIAGAAFVLSKIFGKP